MIYYGLKPVKRILAVKDANSGPQPINAVYFGSRKIWSPDQIPLDKVLLNVTNLIGPGVTTGLVTWFEDPNYPEERTYIGDGTSNLQFEVGAEVVINTYAVEDSPDLQINMYYEKEGEAGTLYENQTYLFIDTSAPGIWNLTISLIDTSIS